MWRASLVLLVACASSRDAFREQVDTFFASHPTSTKNPPNVLGTGPWVLGRWATYSRIGESGARGFEKVTVVAVDACGTWIESTSVDVDGQHRVLVCLQKTMSLDPIDMVREVRWQAGYDLPAMDVDIADRANVRSVVGPLLSKLVEPSRAAGLGGDAHELVEWSDGARVSVVSTVADQSVRTYAERFDRSDSYMLLGAAGGYLTGSERFEGSGLASFALGSGVRVSPRVDLVGNVVLSASDASSMDQMLFVAAVGARYRSAWSRLHLEADLGYSEIMVDTDTMARGGTISGALGVNLFSRRGWSYAIELRDRVFLLGNNEGLRNAFAVAAVLQLDL
ncbi:MAG: hypothetical protein AB7T06_03310 [Kofleriaceae bacterium]